MATAGRWEDLQDVNLHPSILDSLRNDFEFPTMTPVQAAAIPPLLSCKDVCAEAETGSGKTLSFLIPIAQMLLFGRKKRDSILPTILSQRKEVRAIVLLPTRELAMQVHSVAKRLFESLDGDIKPVPLIGGSANSADGGAGPDAKYASDNRVVIATPGRLSAAICGGFLSLTSSFEVLVMDEADRLLDMGFAVTVTEILMRLPKQRRTGMYSATQTKEVEALARAGMRNPVRVVVKVHRSTSTNKSNENDNDTIATRARIPTSVHCYVKVVSPRDKLATLMYLLATHPKSKFIVYSLTCACVEHLRRLPLEKMLNEAVGVVENGSSNEKDSKTPKEKKRVFYHLHGKMGQKRRERSLSQFAESHAGILLCTDVAARGIDIADVDWVVQLDVPQDPDAYIHRVGRTGRLGREGRAMLMLGDWEANYVDFLKVRKCHVEQWVAGDNDNDDKLSAVQSLVKSKVHEATVADRAVLESSEKAFLSFVRAYKEHRCSVLLKVTEVDFDSVADSFGLLRLPRFFEFKKVRDRLHARDTQGVVIRDIKFRDKVRETKRQEDIRQAIANRAERREALQAKSKKKKKKRKRTNNAGSDDDNGGKGTKGGTVGNGLDDDDVEDDFSVEAMQLRKMKRGKLSREQFDKMAGYDDL